MSILQFFKERKEREAAQKRDNSCVGCVHMNSDGKCTYPTAGECSPFTRTKKQYANGSTQFS